jgi:spoIIIJ-associated protein
MENKNTVEVTGKTVEEATELALRQLDAARDEVRIDILARGKSGLLGLGSEPARVKVTRLAATGEELAEAAKEVLDHLLNAMQVSATVNIGITGFDSPDFPGLDVTGQDAGLLIGRHGETLNAIQLIVNTILAQRGVGRQRHVAVDVNHYKNRRYKALQDLALRMASRVAASGRFVTMDPMPANERRVIHLALADHAQVMTQSVGEWENRKVTIMPRTGGTTSSPLNLPKINPESESTQAE